MARIFNRWFGRSKSAAREIRRKKFKRVWRTESLEARNLLAASMFHNQLNPEDVNQDNAVSSLDALIVINEMSGRNAGSELAPGDRMSDVNNDGRRSAVDALMVINRIGRERHGQDRPPRLPGDPAEAAPVDPPAEDPKSSPSGEFRSIDGSGNNLENPGFGAAGTPLLRVAGADYGDGISEPAGENRPSAREISNLLSAANPEGTTSDRNLSSFVFTWGQFLDHDLDLSLEPEDQADAQSFDVEVPMSDPLFDPFGTGQATIHLTRSQIAVGTGTSVDNPAQQVNAITAWIDGSQIYGSDQETADALREFVGGRLRITDNGLLPTDDEGNILAGDVRAAENVVLTSMHALFVREHNRLADEIAASHPDFSDEQIYQQARQQVIAQLQSITFNEFLPAILGRNALSRYEGYDPNVDPAIANEFSTAAFRFGHSTLNDHFQFIGNDGLDVDDPIALADAFFTPSLLEDSGIDPLLKYGASSLSQEVDLQVVDSLRNFLFGPPGAGGLDLVSLNIQRGRDHGLADFNSTRIAYGLGGYASFAELTSDIQLQANLQSLYGDINNVDLWVGLLAEDHPRGSALGETATAIIADQFQRLRDGDRFWYENVLSRNEIRVVETTTLADIIQRNTGIDSLQRDVFFFKPEISGAVSAEQVAVQQDTGGNRNRRGRDRFDKDTGLGGVTVELLDADGNVIDTTVTSRNGKYRFTSMDRTGLYQVRIVAPEGTELNGADTLQVLVSSGDSRVGDMDFAMIV